MSCWPSATPPPSATRPRSAGPSSGWRPCRPVAALDRRRSAPCGSSTRCPRRRRPTSARRAVLRQRRQPHVGHAASPPWRARRPGRVLALAEAGDKVFVAGEFAGAALRRRPPATATRTAARDDRAPAADHLRAPALPVRPRREDRCVCSTGTPIRTTPSSRSRSRPTGSSSTSAAASPASAERPAGRIALLDVETATQVPTFKPPSRRLRRAGHGPPRRHALHRRQLQEARTSPARRQPVVIAQTAAGGRPRRHHRGTADRMPDGREHRRPVRRPYRHADRGRRPRRRLRHGRLRRRQDPLRRGRLPPLRRPGRPGVPRRRHRGAHRLAARTRPAPAGLRADDLARRPRPRWSPPPAGRAARSSSSPRPGGRRRSGWAGPTATPPTSSPPPNGSTWSATTTTASPTRTTPACGTSRSPARCGTPHRKLIAYDARTGDTDASFTAQANTDTGPYVAARRRPPPLRRRRLHRGRARRRPPPPGRVRPLRPDRAARSRPVNVVDDRRRPRTHHDQHLSKGIRAPGVGSVALIQRWSVRRPGGRSEREGGEGTG